MPENKKNTVNKRKRNFILICIFCCYLVALIIYLVKIDKRTVLLTDVVERIDQNSWGGGNGSRYDYYYVKNKDYCLKRRFYMVPSVQVLIERSVIELGTEITYYVDCKQIDEYKGRPIISYTPIGVSTGNECHKKIWYYFSLVSYVLKNTFMILITSIVVLVFIVNFKPIDSMSATLHWLVIIYLIYCFLVQ